MTEQCQDTDSQGNFAHNPSRENLDSQIMVPEVMKVACSATTTLSDDKSEVEDMLDDVDEDFEMINSDDLY